MEGWLARYEAPGCPNRPAGAARMEGLLGGCGAPP
jgi:hypothetical protein